MRETRLHATIKKIQVAFGLLLLAVPLLAHAQADRFGIEYGTGAGIGTRDVRATIATLINVALSILGIVVLAGIVIGGAKMMMAAGNEDEIAGGKKLAGSGVIGLIVIFIAFAITKFVFSVLERST